MSSDGAFDITRFESPAPDPRYVDPIFQSPREELERDQHGRPLIPPPPTGWPDAGNPDWAKEEARYGGRRPYQRASTFAATLDNGAGLAIWKGRHIATQAARQANVDLRAILAGLQYQPKDFATIDRCIASLLDRGASDESSLAAANWGTAAHRFMERNAPPSMPERLEADIDAYREAHRRHGLVIVENEVPVVNDALGVYGTLDTLVELPTPAAVCPKWSHHWVEWVDVEQARTWWCHDCTASFYAPPPQPGFVLVEDKKTGKLHLLGQAIQLYAYTTGQRMDPETGERTSLHPNINTAWAILAHVPLGKAICELHAVNLTLARGFAYVAVGAREARKREKELFRPFEVDSVYRR